jgi:hypothetical protein
MRKIREKHDFIRYALIFLVYERNYFDKIHYGSTNSRRDETHHHSLINNMLRKNQSNFSLDS